MSRLRVMVFLMLMGFLLPKVSAQALTITASSDRANYSPGDNVEISGVVSYGGVGLNDNAVSIALFDPHDQLMSVFTSRTAGDGAFHATFTLSSYAAVGTYHIRLFVTYKGETAFLEMSFEVGSSNVKAELYGSDSGGSRKTEFQEGQAVYVVVFGFELGTIFPVYVMHDGNPADYRPSTSVVTFQAYGCGTGVCMVEPLWNRANASLYGNYDLWADVNNNGVVDHGDVLNDRALDIGAIHVVNEFPWQWIFPVLIAGLTLLLILTQRRKTS